MHRPSMSSAIIVPVVDPGKHNVSKIDLVDRALWLGPQVMSRSLLSLLIVTLKGHCSGTKTV